MKRNYKIPIIGEVLDDKPLTGSQDNPLCSIPLTKMARDAGIKGLTGYECLEYNVDEGWVLIRAEVDTEAHKWLIGMLLTLPQVAKDRGWRLDTKELQRVRAQRL